MQLTKLAFAALVAALALAQLGQAFTNGALARTTRTTAVGELASCKRNTKDEKRMRNREAARRNRVKGAATGKARRRIVRLEKINEVRNSEAEFMATAYTQVMEDVIEKVNPLANM